MCSCQSPTWSHCSREEERPSNEKPQYPGHRRRRLHRQPRLQGPVGCRLHADHLRQPGLRPSLGGALGAAGRGRPGRPRRQSSACCATIRSTPSSISPPTPMSASRCPIRASTSATTWPARSTCSMRCMPLASRASSSRPPAPPMASPTPCRSPRTTRSAPVNPYGESKLFVERALHWHGSAHGLRWTALRYFNAAGADPDGEIGEDHDPETHLIPLAIETALGAPPELQVMGTDYADAGRHRDPRLHPRDGPGRCTRSRAPAPASRAALRRPINLGTGTGYSVRDVVAMVERVTGRKVKTRNAPRRAGDPPALVAAPGRARELLGWQPRSGLAWRASFAPHTAGIAGIRRASCRPARGQWLAQPGRIRRPATGG